MGEPEGYDYKELIYRVGTFFLLVAIGLLVIFFLSEGAGQTAFEYLCWSTLLFVVGFGFRSQYKRSIRSSGRFSVFQRFRRGAKEDKGRQE